MCFEPKVMKIVIKLNIILFETTLIPNDYRLFVRLPLPCETQKILKLVSSTNLKLVSLLLFRNYDNFLTFFCFIPRPKLSAHYKWLLFDHLSYGHSNKSYIDTRSFQNMCEGKKKHHLRFPLKQRVIKWPKGKCFR